MVSQSCPSVHIVCVPDWCKVSFLCPPQTLPCKAQDFTESLQISWQEQKNRGLGEGSASLSSIACSHRPIFHKIPFIQQ